MNVEIINTSRDRLTLELEEALMRYAPYYDYREQRNRITVDTENLSYDLRCIFVKMDDDHMMIWISDWYVRPREK